MNIKVQNSIKTERHSQILGFTLIELLVTIAIMMIVIAFAYPNIMKYLANSESKRIRHLLHNNIKLAKATSYTYHKRVFMCLTNPAGDCDKEGNESIVLFFDKNDNNNFDSGDSLISQQTLNLNYARVYLRAGRRHYIRFAADTGRPRGFFGHFKYCPTHHYNSNMYQLSFSQLGVVRFKPNSLHPTGC